MNIGIDLFSCTEHVVLTSADELAILLLSSAGTNVIHVLSQILYKYEMSRRDFHVSCEKPKKN